MKPVQYMDCIEGTACETKANGGRYLFFQIISHGDICKPGY